MKSWNWKKFLALFMAVTMVLASGIFVTNQSFKATDDESYQQEETEDQTAVEVEDEGASEETVEVGENQEEQTPEQEAAAPEQEAAPAEEADQPAEAEQVVLKYDANSDAVSGKVPDEVSLDAGTEVEAAKADDFALDGYVFDSWNTKADGTGDKVEAEKKYKVAETTTLYAQWMTPEEKAASDAAEAEASNEETAATDTENVEAAPEETQESEEEETAEKKDESEEKTDEELAEDNAKYPAGSFSEKTANGVYVSVSYPIGVFPDGVTMKVRDVSEKKALDAVSDVVEDATEAAAVDISFYDKDGKEIQPRDGGSVSVSMSLTTPLMGDEQTLVHVDDSGKATEISANESANSASFSADSFSIYVLVGNGQEYTGDFANRTYDYAIEAYDPLTLAENVKYTNGNYCGGEWKIKSGEDIISFAKGAVLNPESSTEQKTVDIKTSGKAGDAVVTFDYKDSKGSYQDTYTIHVKGYTLHFDLNGGSGNTPADVNIGMTAGGTVLAQLPSGEGITRNGFKLIGWTLVKDAMTSGRRNGWYDKIYDLDDGNAATTTDMYSIARGGAESYTFYAAWAHTSNVSGQIGFFIRDDGSIQTEPGSYSSSYYTTVTPGGDYYKKVCDLCDYITMIKTETNLNNVAANITAKAWKEVYAEINKNHKDLLSRFPGLTTDGTGYYITWYVIKDQGSWHVDGVIRGSANGKEKATLDYLPNCNDYSGQAPVGNQYATGSELTIQGRNTLTRTGYTFGGWNTEPDGSGFGYQQGSKITLTEDTILYAQWLPNNDTAYTLLCYDAETGDEISNARKVRYGTTGNTVEADEGDMTLEGYKYVEDDERNVTEAQIKPDGTTTLKLYFEKGRAIRIQANNENKVYDGVAVTPQISSLTVDGVEVSDYTSDKDGNITVKIDGRDYTIEGVNLAMTDYLTNESVNEAVDAGTYVVSIGNGESAVVKNSSGKEANITVRIDNGIVSIEKRELTITSKGGEWEYDGKAHKVEEADVVCTNDDEKVWADGDELPDLKYTGSQKAVGETLNTFEVKSGDTWEELFPNYTITTNCGTLKVTGRNTKYEITVNATPYTGEYNGKKQSPKKDAFTIAGATEEQVGDKSALQRLGDLFSGTETRKFIFGGDVYYITGLSVKGEAADAGVYENGIVFDGNETIKDDDGNDVTEQFRVIKNPASLTITKKLVTISSASDEKIYDGKPLTNSEIEEDGWIGSDGADYSVTGTITAVGFEANTFTYTLKDGTNADNYDIRTQEGTLTVKTSNKGHEITVTPNGSNGSGQTDPNGAVFKYDGQPHSVSGFLNETDKGIKVIYDGDTYYVKGLTAEATATDAGTAKVTVTGTPEIRDKDDNNVSDEFNISVADAFLVIEKRTVVMTSASLSKEYDGDALMNPAGDIVVDEKTAEGITIEEGLNGSLTGDGFVEGEGATYTFTGKKTHVGNTPNTYDYTLDENTKADNYIITTNYGTLTVRNRDARFDVEVTGNTNEIAEGEGESARIPYDGAEHSISGFVGETANGIPVEAGGKTYYVTGLATEVRGTDAGSYTTSTTGTAIVKDSSGKDVSDQFNVTVKPGKLVISKADVTLTSATIDKVYDGKTLTNGDTKMAVELGFAEGEGASYSYTGSQTVVGSSENSYSYTLNSNTKAENYNIKATAGLLVVKNRSESGEARFGVTVTAKSATETYDGSEKSISGFENETDKGIEVSANGEKYYVLGLTSVATGRDASSGINTTISGTPVVIDEKGNDVSAEFEVTQVPGTLKINKRSITITSQGGTWEYDGTAHTVKKVDVTLTSTGSRDNALVEGDELPELKFTGSQKAVGESDNTFEPASKTKTFEQLLPNYNVKTAYGTLKVTGRNTKYEISVVPEALVAEYDGSKHSPQKDAFSLSGASEESIGDKSILQSLGDVFTKTETRKFTLGEGTYYITGLSVSGEATDAGVYEGRIIVSGDETIKDDDGNDVTEQFIVNKNASADLTITRKALSIASQDCDKTYDGKPLINNKDILEDGWVGSDGADYSFTGSQTAVGESANAFTYTLKEGTNGNNYDITKKEGKLIVNSSNEGFEIIVVPKGSDGSGQAGPNGGTFLYDGDEHSVSGFVNEGEKGIEVVANNNETYYVTGLSASAAATDAGTYQVAISGKAIVKDAAGNDVTGEFKITVSNAYLVINKRTVTMTSASLSKRFDGDALKNPDGELLFEEADGINIDSPGTLTGDGFAEGEGATYQFSGTKTHVGSAPNTYKYTLNEGTRAENYDITANTGTLTITNRDARYEVTITGNSNKKAEGEGESTEIPYDGKEHSIDGFVGQTEDGVPVEADGKTYYVTGVTTTATGTDAGEYITTSTGTPVVKDSSGADVTDQFSVNVIPGKLVIDPAKVTLKSANLNKPYDGKPLTNGDTEMAINSGWAEGEGADITFTGSQTIVGESDNSYTYVLKTNTKASNYEIDPQVGKLAVGNRGEAGEDLFTITVTAKSGTEDYDGTEKTVTGFLDETDKGIEVEYDGEKYYVTGITSEAKGVDATTGIETTFSGNPVVKDKDGNDVTAQFNVDKTPGTLVINKRRITVASAGGEWEYDGTLHTKEEVAVTLTETGSSENVWVGTDKLPNIKFTGGQKAVGTSKNAFEPTVNDTWEELLPNYDVTIAYGDLTVTGRNTKYEISVNATPYKGTYNGSAQSPELSAFTIGGASEEKVGDKTLLQSLGDRFTKTETRKFTLGGGTYFITGLSVSGDATDAGVYKNRITINGEETIKDDDGNDVTEQFIVNKNPATLTIEKQKVTLTSASISKVYDGVELTNGEAEVTEIGWIEGQGVESYDFTGSQTVVGTSDNSFTYKLGEGTNADNYDIITSFGRLTVTSSNAAYEIIVTPKGSSSADPEGGKYLYDGKEKSISGFINESDGAISVTGSNGQPYTVTGLKAEAKRTDAGATAVSVSGTAIVTDAKGNDVTNEFSVNIGEANLVIEKRSLTMTSASLSKEFDGDALTNGSAELTVDEKDGITIVNNGGISGDGFAEGEGASYEFTASKTHVGSTANSFEYTLNDGTKASNYNIKEPVFGTLTIRNRDARYEVSITGNINSETNGGDIGYDGKEHTSGGFVGETDKGVPVEAGGHTYYVTEVTSEAAGTDAGEYPTTTEGSPRVVDEDGNDVTDDFDVTVVPGKLIIKKATVNIQSADLNKSYDGKALVNGTTAMAVETGWANGEGAIYTFTGTQTLVGSSANSYTYVLKDNTKADNYNINTSSGTLTVTNRADNDLLSVVVTAKGATEKYDGEEKRISGFLDETEKGIRVESGGETFYVTGITSEAKSTNATDGIKTTVTGTPVVKDADGNDVSAQFSVIPQPGTLVVEKRNITLTSATKSKPYDGKALVNGDDKVEIGGEGLAKGEGISYSFTGSQTIVGASPNYFSYSADEGTDLSNYSIVPTEGTLTVTSRDAKFDITITGKSTDAKYDGREHTLSGFENENDKGQVEIEAEGTRFYVTGMTSEKTAVNVAESGKTTISGTPCVTDENGNDVSDQFAITAEPGSLNITKRNVSLTSETRSKLYDGYPLTNGDGKVTVGGDGLAENETLEFEFTGSQTLAGSSKNFFTYSFGNVGGQVNDESKSDNNSDSKSSSDEGAKLFNFVMEVHAADADEASDASAGSAGSVLATRIGDESNYNFEIVYGDLIVTVEDDGTTTGGNDGEDDKEDGDGEGGGPVTVDPSKVVSKNHEEGVYKKGQEIEFTVTATNIYADKRDITIREIEGVTLEKDKFEDVEPGAVVSTKAHYTITEADVVAGGFKNTATVDISDPKDGAEDPNVQPGTGGYKAEDDVIVEEKNPSLSIIKRSNASGTVKLGEELEYTISVINNGNVAVSQIQVSDDLTGDKWTVEKLEAGESKDFDCTYTVNESDVAAGKVVNTAKATGADPSGKDVEGTGETTDSVNQTYRLTIHYVDEQGNALAADYVNSFQYKSTFYIESPVVSGYTPQYTFVQSDENGMPAKNVEVTVPYVKNPSQPPKTEDEKKDDTGSDDENTTEENTTGGGSDDSGSSSGSSGSTGNVGNDNSGGTSSGVNNDGSHSASRIASPQTTNDAISNAGVVTDGAVVSTDSDGNTDLVAIGDQETPLSNMLLGDDHRCNVLAFLLLLAAMLVVSLHSKNMKEHQAKVFELKEKLGGIR